MTTVPRPFSNIEKAFQSEYEKLFLPERIIQKAIKEKLKTLKIKLTKKEDEALRDSFSKKGLPTFTLSRKRSGPDKIIKIEFSESEIKQLLGKPEQMLKELPAKMDSFAETMSARLYKKMISDWRERRDYERFKNVPFEEKLYGHWKRPLDYLQMVITTSFEIGSAISENGAFRKSKNSALVEVLLRLHARACLIACEAIHLLKGGFSDGAMARWRTLHEVTVTATFISMFDDALAIQYMHHEIVESYKAALQLSSYQDFYFDKLKKNEFKKLSDSYQFVLQKYGKSFSSQYGWAGSVLNKKEPNFSEIEKHINLDYYRPYYKMASHSVHSNSKGITFSLGIHKKNKILLAGPSDLGLPDPGSNIAHSLTQITRCFLIINPTLDMRIYTKILSMMSELVTVEFNISHKKIMEKYKSEKTKTHQK